MNPLFEEIFNSETELDPGCTIISDRTVSRNFTGDIININSVNTDKYDKLIIESSIENFTLNFEKISELINENSIIVIDNSVYSSHEEVNFSYHFSTDSSNLLKKLVNKNYLIFQNIPNVVLSNVTIDSNYTKFKNIRFDLELNNCEFLKVSSLFKNLQSLHLMGIENGLDFDFNEYPDEILVIKLKDDETNRDLLSLNSRIWGNLFLNNFDNVSNLDLLEVGTFAIECKNEQLNMSNIRMPKCNLIWVILNSKILNIDDCEFESEKISISNTVELDLSNSRNLNMLANCKYLELKNKAIDFLNLDNGFNKVETLEISLKNPFQMVENTFVNLQTLQIQTLEEFNGSLEVLPDLPNLKILRIVNKSNLFNWLDSVNNLNNLLTSVDSVSIINCSSSNLVSDNLILKETFPNLNQILIRNLPPLRFRN